MLKHGEEFRYSDEIYSFAKAALNRFWIALVDVRTILSMKCEHTFLRDISSCRNEVKAAVKGANEY